MNEHERSIELAARSIRDLLAPEDGAWLDRHLGVCGNCRRAQAGFRSDDERLRQLVAPRPVNEATRVAVLAAIRAGRGGSLVQVLLVAALLLLALVAALVIRAGSQPLRLPHGFAGSWITHNCATWFAAGASPSADCGRWGDGASIVLDIGDGTLATIRVSGLSASDCLGTGRVEVPPPMDREGTFMRFDNAGPACPLIELGIDAWAHFYLEPGDQRIWFDDDGDGWGLFWTRVP